jgi:hypothetical protein
MREFYDRFKDRKTHRVASADLVEYHGEFSKKFPFPVPIHPRNMSQMIHPWQGYLAAYADRGFTFNDLHHIYLN